MYKDWAVKYLMQNGHQSAARCVTYDATAFESTMWVLIIDADRTAAPACHINSLPDIST